MGNLIDLIKYVYLYKSILSLVDSESNNNKSSQIIYCFLI